MTETEVPQHPCIVTGCDHVIQGIRHLDDVVQPTGLAEVLGVPSAFFGNQHLYSEAQRVEHELQKHLESHSVLDWVLTVKGLRDEVARKR